MENNYLELSGLIIKEENVCNVSTHLLNNTTVLESCHPMPGYFGKNSPDAGRPRSLFILLDMDYEPLLLARKLKMLSQARQHRCYGSFGKITIGRKTYPTVRIKNLECFTSVPDIQNALSDAGFRLLKFKKINDAARIEIHKSFKVNQLEEGIYLDLLESDRSYLSMPSELDWDQFESLTKAVKNNLENNLFDAALGLFWRLDGPEDVIRVYDRNHSLERMREIRQAYQHAIQRSS